jgi:hypothetical protein
VSFTAKDFNRKDRRRRKGLRQKLLCFVSCAFFAV